VRVNVAAPVQLAGKVVKTAISPVVKLERKAAKASAMSALSTLMETDEGRLQLFNMLVAAGGAKKQAAE